MPFRKGGDGGADDDLPLLTRAQARRLRVLVRQAMAERGREVAVSGGQVKDARGTLFGLQNIAAACRHDPRGERAWPELIGEYADMALAASSAGTLSELGRLTADQVRDHVFAVIKRADSPGPLLASHRAAPELAPGLPDLLASPGLAAKIPGAADPRYGILAAMPCSHRAHLHVLRDRTALPSLTLMARYTRVVYHEEPGPVSPDVLWWHDGTWTALTSYPAETVRVTGDLAAILRDLGAAPPPPALSRGLRSTITRRPCLWARCGF